MNALYALYSDGHQAQRAVDRLRAAGVTDNDITVISAEPLEDFEFAEIGKSSWMWYIAWSQADLCMTRPRYGASGD